MLSLLLAAGCALARVPTEAQLACDACDRAQMWVHGAQDAALLALQTLFGGHTCAGQTIDACFEHAPQLSTRTCIAKEPGPADCRGCNLLNQIALDACCDVPALEAGDPPFENATTVCRTNRQWLAVGFAKLEGALELHDRCPADASGADAATNLACAAEHIISTVLSSLGTEFTSIDATYRHITSKKRRVSFACGESETLQVLVRTTQSFRACACRDRCPEHALVATYTQFQLAPGYALGVGTHQLLWPIGGTVSAFDKTGLPRDAHCSLRAEPPTRDPAYVPEFRLPTLGRLDFARVVEGFTRCDGMPRNGHVKSFFDLSAERCCNTLPLVADVTAAARLRRNDVDPTVFALVYVAHHQSSITYESDPTRDVAVHASLLLRRAAADLCADCEIASVEPLVATLGAAPAVAVERLGAGESRCVGGSASGRPCTAVNECGAGLACTVQPGGAALCFDGSWWNSAMPCSVADAQCPYGECYGAVRGGIVDGALPYAYVWRDNACDEPDRATPICNDALLRAWHRSTE